MVYNQIMALVLACMWLIEGITDDTVNVAVVSIVVTIFMSASLIIYQILLSSKGN